MYILSTINKGKETDQVDIYFLCGIIRPHDPLAQFGRAVDS